MESYPLLTGILCYLIGLIVGVYSTKGTVAKKVAAALQEGLDKGRAEAEEEKAETGKVLTSKLRKLQETLVETLDAYEDTVKTVDEKLSPQAGNQLSLEYKPATRSLPQPEERSVASSEAISSSVASSQKQAETSEPEMKSETDTGRGTGVLGARETGSFTSSTSGERLRKTIFSRSGERSDESDDKKESALRPESHSSSSDEDSDDVSGDRQGKSEGDSKANGIATSPQVH